MQALKLLFVFIFTLLLVSCASNWHAGQTQLPQHESAQKALEKFESVEELQAYFANAKAVAVFPNSLRGGTGFGGAFATGWLISDEEILARLLHWQFFAGADIGAQWYSQILFFKTDEAVEKYKAMRFEFAGQANATALTFGKAWTPSYNDDVAIFTLIAGGLLLEGSVGLHSYHVLKP